jgi:hypothetical protein
MVTSQRSGSPLARVGDAVAVFFGATVPYVLRQVQRGFLLVRDAYIHGAMYREAILRADLLPRGYRASLGYKPTRRPVVTPGCLA